MKATRARRVGPRYVGSPGQHHAAAKTRPPGPVLGVVPARLNTPPPRQPGKTPLGPSTGQTRHVAAAPACTPTPPTHPRRCESNCPPIRAHSADRECRQQSLPATDLPGTWLPPVGVLARRLSIGHDGTQRSGRQTRPPARRRDWRQHTEPGLIPGRVGRLSLSGLSHGTSQPFVPEPWRAASAAQPVRRKVETEAAAPGRSSLAPR